MTVQSHRITLLTLLAALLALGAAACKKGPDDAALAAEVQKKIAADVPGAMVTASSKEGTVTLTGTVDNEEAKGKVETSAKSVEGVKGVTNSVTVKAPTPPPITFSPDTELKSKVDANLARYNVTGVTASVANSEVTLTGTIARAKLQDAMKAANEAMPKKVNNQLTIK